MKEGLIFLKKFYENRALNNITHNTRAGSVASQDSTDYKTLPMYSVAPPINHQSQVKPEIAPQVGSNAGL